MRTEGQDLGMQNEKASVLRTGAWRAWPLKIQPEERPQEGTQKNVREDKAIGLLKE